MQFVSSMHIARLRSLIGGVFSPPPGKMRIIVALFVGVFCHAVFGMAVLAMIAAMYFGMSESFGGIASPWSYLLNVALVLQFPLVHSILLTGWGSKLLSTVGPKRYAKTLSTTTYAIVASLQLLALFALWTPSGVVWWRAEGAMLVVMTVLYAMSWLLLLKASFDAGAEVQSGALGWMSMVQDKMPVFPDMPATGLFCIIRQPIYVAFALTLWTVPVWTPDQLFLAITLTAYCLLAPLLREKRFKQRYGQRFEEYRRRVPYALPRLAGRKAINRANPSLK
ncbi:MAG: isoprenylcysteine carboxylmethyltransferase family protein [Devosiaceae bacterium]|nr:isoprenylcysteine carboxylmethyltransferase family protein [Devosiaceae bacterium MH13]